MTKSYVGKGGFEETGAMVKGYVGQKWVCEPGAHFCLFGLDDSKGQLFSQ